MQHNAADQLHVEVPHLEHAAARFAADGEGLDQQVVERLALLDAPLELGGLGGQLLVGELLDLRLAVANRRHHGRNPLGFARMLGTENFRQEVVKHGGTEEGNPLRLL